MDTRLDIARQQDNDQAIKTVQEANDLFRNPPTVAVYEKKLVLAFIIIPFAIAGALIRIGLQRLETYAGSPVFGLVYAQWLGCLIMGVVTLHKNNLFLFYHPLQVGLATGLCGSITTFSSWQYGIFGGFANTDGAAHTRGKNVLTGLSECLVTLAMAFSGYHLGHHIARLLEHIGLFSPLLRRFLDQQNTSPLKGTPVKIYRITPCPKWSLAVSLRLV
jgi:fluoride ion exporter CrcB/FEX